MSNELTLTEAHKMPEFEAICMNIAELEQQLLQQDPQMPQYLRRIHTALLHHPELVHILRDEQRAIIIDGLMQITGTLLSEVNEKQTKTTRAKQLARQNEDDI